MWIIAGPNGAGKSSFAVRFLDDLGHRKLTKLNADNRTLELRKMFPEATQNDLNLRAAIETDKEVEDLIKAKRSFVVETVLSSQKYRDDVLAAEESGFKFGLIYISLYPPELPRSALRNVQQEAAMMWRPPGQLLGTAGLMMNYVGSRQRLISS
jgi:predicted ABC-type ATPase